LTADAARLGRPASASFKEMVYERNFNVLSQNGMGSMAAGHRQRSKAVPLWLFVSRDELSESTCSFASAGRLG
jgi:hypothetical protein